MDTRALWPAPGVDPLNHWGDFYGRLCESGPYKSELELDALARSGYQLNRAVLVCIRNVEPFADEPHPMRSAPKYDDTGILLWRGGCQVFPMSSHAYQLDSKLSPDVDGDGRGDVGTIWPGRYIARDLQTGKYPTFLVTEPDGDGHLPCWRDVNHNGIIEQDETLAAYTATQILIHGGIDDPPDSPHHYSIGCQCVPLKWRKLMVEKCHAVGGGVLEYVLIRVEDAMATVGRMTAGAGANA